MSNRFRYTIAVVFAALCALLLGACKPMPSRQSADAGADASVTWATPPTVIVAPPFRPQPHRFGAGTPPYAKVIVSVNSGAGQSGGITVHTSDSIQLTGESTVGWSTQKWEIYEYPAGFTQPTGWSTDSNNVFYSTSVTPQSFTLPASATLWGKYMIRLRINDALTNASAASKYTDESTALEIVSTNSLHDIAAGETNQFDSTRGWVASLKSNFRAMDNGLVPAQSTVKVNQQNVPWKSTARAVVTSNIANLASASVTQDGVTLVQTNRVLLTGQTTASQNGLYDVGVVSGGLAPLTRSSDMAASADVLPGSVVHVSEGTANANSDWYLQTQGTITLGSTPLNFQVVNNEVNVRRFGAKGDGTTDDTTAINAALAALINGGRVIVPGGTYKITSHLIATKPIVLRGDGRGISTISVTGTGYNALDAKTSVTIEAATISRANSATATTDAGIRIDFSIDPPLTGTFVRLRDAELLGMDIGVYLNGGANRDIYFIEAEGTSITSNSLQTQSGSITPTINANNVREVHVRGGQLTQPKSDSSNNVYCIGSSVLTFDGVHVKGGVGIKILTNPSNSVQAATISGCHFDSTALSILTMTDQNSFHELAVKDNFFDTSRVLNTAAGDIEIGDAGTAAPATYDYGQVSIEGNTWKSCTNGPIFLDTSTSHRIGTVNVRGNRYFGWGSGSTVSALTRTTGSVYDHLIVSDEFADGQSTGRNYFDAAAKTFTISTATNATPIAVTTSVSHGLRTGDIVTIAGVTGNTAANGVWVIAVTGATTFTLNTSVGNGAYVNGGTVTVGTLSLGHLEEKTITNTTLTANNGQPMTVPLGVVSPNGSTAVYAKNTSGNGNLALVRTSGNDLYLGAHTNDVYADAASLFRVLVNSSTQVSFNSGTAVFTATPTLNTTNIDWLSSISTPNLRHIAQTSDVACTDMNFTAQAPWASATGTNRNSGGFLFTIASAAAGGTAGSFKVSVAGATNFQVTPTGPVLSNGTNKRVEVNSTGMGLFGATPIAQPSRVGQVTNSTGGTAGTACTAVDANCIATLIAKINGLEAALSAAGGGIGVTQ